MKKLRGTRRAFGAGPGRRHLRWAWRRWPWRRTSRRAASPSASWSGFTAGGGTDAQARIVAQKLGEVLGTSVIVDTSPAPAPCSAASEVARAPPDGYTLLYAPSSTMAQNLHTFAQVPYDPFKDFTAISMGGRGPLVLSAEHHRAGRTT